MGRDMSYRPAADSDQQGRASTGRDLGGARFLTSICMPQLRRLLMGLFEYDFTLMTFMNAVMYEWMSV